jgi:DNA-binding CsgD family transcriptional regulator
LHPNLRATAKRNAEIVRRVEAGASKASVARAFGLSPTRVWHIIQKSEERTIVAEIAKLANAGHNRQRAIGRGSEGAISVALPACMEDPAVMAYLVRSPGAFKDVMSVIRREGTDPDLSAEPET